MILLFYITAARQESKSQFLLLSLFWPLAKLTELSKCLLAQRVKSGSRHLIQDNEDGKSSPDTTQVERKLAVSATQNLGIRDARQILLQFAQPRYSSQPYLSWPFVQS